MFEGVGKNIGVGAVEGALGRISEACQRFNVNSAVLSVCQKFQGVDLKAAAEHFPIIGTLMLVGGDVKAGYDSMTPEEKAKLWKDVMIASAALAAKAAAASA